jgi:opacity protein-like surface antigen
MKSVTAVVVSCLMILPAFAQDNVLDKKARFSSINQFGLLVGANTESVLIQSINGVKKDKWFGGFGAGIDFYVERGAPLFIDIRRELTKGNSALFLYADGGMYLPWPNFIQKERKLNSTISHGGYYDAGVGWKLTDKNKRSFLLGVGYTFKQNNEERPVQSWNPSISAFESCTENYKYTYRRLVLKVGMQL